MNGLSSKRNLKYGGICMTIQDILDGESKYIESKESLLDKSIGTHETRLFENQEWSSCFCFLLYLIEHWENGIPRIIEIINTAGLRPPEFIGGDIDLKVNIYRDQRASAAFDNTAACEPNDRINDPVDLNRELNNS